MKNNKIKRVLSAMLTGVMLLGLSVTANAESTGNGTNACSHVYIQSRSYYHSSTLGSHPYSEKVIKEDHTVETLWKTCDKAIYYYHYKCTCVFCKDYYITEDSRQEIRHMQCGAPNEG